MYYFGMSCDCQRGNVPVPVSCFLHLDLIISAGCFSDVMYMHETTEGLFEGRLFGVLQVIKFT